MTPRRDRRRRRLRLCGVAAAAAYGAGVAAVLLQRDPRVTSYLVATPSLQTVGLIAGFALLAVGGVLVVTRRRGHLGPVTLLVAVACLAAAWSSWEDGPALVRSLAAVTAPMLVPLLVHVVALARRDAVGRAARPWVAAAYALVTGAVLVRALVYEPQRDRHCWVDCGPDANAFLLVTHMRLAASMGTAQHALTILLAATAVVAAIGSVSAVGARRARVAAVAGPAALALVAEAAYAVVLLQDPRERFEAGTGSIAFLVRSGALVALAGGLAWTSGALVAARLRTARLARELSTAPDPGRLQERISRTLHDDDLEVHYWSEPAARYLDSEGHTVEHSAHDPRALTHVVHGDEPVAVVLHDRTRVSSLALREEVGSAARLALDNERLRVQWLADARELRRSRARIVASADERRRALERDLHDGAQQRLIAAAYELRLALEESAATGDDQHAAKLARAVAQSAAVLAGLRTFAHGVFPAILDEAGLREALVSLAEDATVPVEVDCTLGRRAPATERAAYVVVRAAVEAPADVDGPVSVRVVEEGDVMVVEATGVGTLDTLRLADRVGAVGGTVHAGGGRLRAVLP